MDAVVGTLIGVALGGGITSGQVWIRERKSDDREQASREREERQAMRMIREEIANLHAELDWAVRYSVWWGDDTIQLSTSAWDEFAKVLAASDMDDKTWRWLAFAYHEVHRMNDQTRAAVKRYRGAPAFGTNAHALAVTLRLCVERGIEFLEAYMEGAAPPEVKATEGGDIELGTPILDFEDDRPDS